MHNSTSASADSLCSALEADLANILCREPGLGRHAALITHELRQMLGALAAEGATLPDRLSSNPLERDVQELAEAKAVLFALRASVDLRLAELHKQLEVAQDRRDVVRCAEEGPLDWSWLLTGDGISRVAYRQRQKALEARGLSSACVFEDTRQAVVQVALSWDENGQSNLEQTLRGLEEVLPFVVPRKDGCRWFRVSEHTCCASHSYYGRVDEQAGRYVLMASRHRDHEEFVATSLRELLAYVLQHHWCFDSRHG